MAKLLIYLVVGLVITGGMVIVSEWDVPKRVYAGAAEEQEEIREDRVEIVDEKVELEEESRELN